MKNPFFRFIVVFTILIILWFGFYENIYELEPIFGVDIQRQVSLKLANLSNWFVAKFGFTPSLSTNTDYVITSLVGDYYGQGVWIGEPCNGIKVFGLFSIFIIAFEGSWKDKIWFIPLGLLLLHFINAIRIALLTIIAAKYPDLLDFNHNITFQIIVYGVVFFLWYIWVNKFSKKRKETTKI